MTDVNMLAVTDEMVREGVAVSLALVEEPDRILFGGLYRAMAAKAPKLSPSDRYVLESFRHENKNLQIERDAALSRLASSREALCFQRARADRLEAEKSEIVGLSLAKAAYLQTEWAAKCAETTIERDAARDECQTLRDQLAKYTTLEPKPTPSPAPSFLRAIRAGNKAAVGLINGTAPRP